MNVTFWQLLSVELPSELSLYQHESTATLSPTVKPRLMLDELYVPEGDWTASSGAFVSLPAAAPEKPERYMEVLLDDRTKHGVLFLAELHSAVNLVMFGCCGVPFM